MKLVDSSVNPPLVSLLHVAKEFRVARNGLLGRDTRVLRAVDDVSLELNAGETFALVGESGSGKTTTARLVLRVEDPTDGKVLFEGNDVTKLSASQQIRYRGWMSAVFQDPSTSLNPRMRIKTIIAEPLASSASKPAREDVDARVEAALEEVHLRPSHGGRYPHQFSGGQRQRIAIARAIVSNPRLIVLDEPVSSLDVSIRAQIMNMLKTLQQKHAVAYLLISHNLATVRFLSHHVGVMYLGQLVEAADTASIFTRPAHPYTVALLSASGTSDKKGTNEVVLAGDPPSPLNPPTGCRFHTRCWLRQRLGNPANCVVESPILREVRKGQLAACHWSEKIAQAPARSATDRVPSD
jgi:oligopeptide transport system ATP-binding protein